MKHTVVAAIVVICGLCISEASAQLRIVSLNGSNSGSSTSGPRAGMGTILSAIGSTVSDDPTMPGNTGIIKPIDVLCLQEANGSATTGASYAALLNQIYATNAYSFVNMNGDSTGSGTQVVVYNSSAVQLIDSSALGIASPSGQPRQTLRYQLRPVGYGSDADIYIYNSHFKAGSTSTDATRRNTEAQVIRGDVNTLPANANVIYLGDLNVYNASESMFTTMTAAGNGRALDPINKTNWAANSSFKNIHTQSPFNSSTDPGNGFNGTGGGMDDRFDWQLVTSNLNDGHGVAYINNSYQAFGNNGSHNYDQPINTGTGASPQTLFYLASILDHLPIVADYQLPAKMSVSVAPVPSQVIVGANVPLTTTVSNSAPVTLPIGADRLDYSVSGSGAIAGSASGMAFATLGGNVHVLSIDTSTPGIRSGAVIASSTSEAVAGGSFNQPISTTVLAHADASLSQDSDQHVRTIDFGIRARGLPAAPVSFSIFNRPDISGFTAALDVDSIGASGDSHALWSNVAPLQNIPAGDSASFWAMLDTQTTGNFATTYTLAVSDQNLPGEISLPSLTLLLKGRVALGGDANLDGMVNLNDFNILAANYGSDQATWQLADFNGDASVTLADFNLLAANFGLSASLDGPTPSDWAALASSVPEPSTLLITFLVSSIAIRRHRQPRTKLGY